MEHPHATEFRKVMAAAAEGDVATMYANTHEDFFALNDIGAGPWREVYGREAFFAFFGQFVEYLEGTFRQDILDVIGYDDHVVAIVHETGTRQGHVFDNRAIYLFEIVDGRWASMRSMDMDHDKINAFWDAVGMPVVEPVAG
jgi:ketosteroid isomerase-like protein